MRRRSDDWGTKQSLKGNQTASTRLELVQHYASDGIYCAGTPEQQAKAICIVAQLVKIVFVNTLDFKDFFDATSDIVSDH